MGLSVFDAVLHGFCDDDWDLDTLGCCYSLKYPHWELTSVARGRGPDLVARTCYSSAFDDDVAMASFAHSCALSPDTCGTK